MPKYRIIVTSEITSDENIPEMKFSGTSDEMDRFVNSLPDYDMKDTDNTFILERID
jgi:hypothetical protein